jgi:hypothetical protein
MPFDKRAIMELANDGRQPRTVTCTIVHAPLTRPMETLGYFHARWHRDADLDPRRPIDWTLLTTTGRGRYCGVMLYVWNPLGSWWGEGDEKFFIDGEPFPSTFGTGSEDYFGYAWCSNHLFNRAYHNQTVSVENNGCANKAPADSGGHISNNRFHITDNVPFHESFEGAIEKYFSNDRLTRYACVAYWYQSPPMAAAPPLPPVDERLFTAFANEMVLYRFYRDVQAYAGQGSIEGLREMYDRLVADAHLADYHTELTLKMARAERTAGHDDRSRSLVAPFIQALTEPFVVREHANDILKVLDRSGPQSQGSRPLLVDNPDGSVKRVRKEGRWAIATERDELKQYIYFAVPDDADMRNKDRTVTFTVSFYGTGRAGDVFRIQYDSHYANNVRGFYHNSRDIPVPADRPGWHQAAIECPRARLAGHQNNQADFRIAAVGDGDVFIGDVRLRWSE